MDNWRQILDLNVLGLSICTKEAIESMNERQVDGHIININRLVTLQLCAYIYIYIYIYIYHNFKYH